MIVQTYLVEDNLVRQRLFALAAHRLALSSRVGVGEQRRRVGHRDGGLSNGPDGRAADGAAAAAGRAWRQLGREALASRRQLHLSAALRPAGLAGHLSVARIQFWAPKCLVYSTELLAVTDDSLVLRRTHVQLSRLVTAGADSGAPLSQLLVLLSCYCDGGGGDSSDAPELWVFAHSLLTTANNHHTVSRLSGSLFGSTSSTSTTLATVLLSSGLSLLNIHEMLLVLPMLAWVYQRSGGQPAAKTVLG